MKTVLAILMWTLSLFGIELGHQVRVDRVQRDGADVLYSKVDARPTGTRFECVRSASGKCYYTVAQPCDTTAGATRCAPQPQHLVLAMGETRQLAGRRALPTCVSAEAGGVGAGCE